MPADNIHSEGNGQNETTDTRTIRLMRESIVVDMVHPGVGGRHIFDHISGSGLDKLKTRTDLAALDEAFFLPHELALSGESTVLQEWWRASGVTVGSLGISDLSQEGIDEVAAIITRYCSGDLPWLRFVRNAEEIRRAKADGVQAYYLYCQPSGSGSPHAVRNGIPRDIGRLDAAHAIGLRMLMLTYNRMDYVGCGCTERVDAGLSMYGLDVVQRCNELGILLDTSHCGRQTTLDACRHSKVPVSANHTGAAAIFSHVRNKSDDELKAIADTGGIVGIYTLPFFISGKPSASLDDVFDHIDYIVNLIGWRHVGIGTDWPIQAPMDILTRTLGPMGGDLGFRQKDNVSVEPTLTDFQDFRAFPNFCRGLVQRGYSDEQIRAILGGNFVDLLERTHV